MFMDTNYWIVAVLFAAAAVLSVFGLLGKRRHEAGREAVSAQMLLDDPLVRQWLDTHLTGEHAGNIRAIREQFGLGLGDASVLWNAYRSRFRQPESGRSESETEKDG